MTAEDLRALQAPLKERYCVIVQRLKPLALTVNAVSSVTAGL